MVRIVRDTHKPTPIIAPFHTQHGATNVRNQCTGIRNIPLNL